MRNPSLPLAALAAALAVPVCVPAAAASLPAPARLRGGDCLDPARARGFSSLDARHLLVDAGRRRYRIELAHSCWNLDFANVIGFRGDFASNRVCGGVLDAVLVRGEPPCRIARMELLDADAYAAALRDRDAWRRAQREARAAAKKR